jgi:hypothetical protein
MREMAEPTKPTSGAVLAIDQKLSQLGLNWTSQWTELCMIAKNVLTNYGTDHLCTGQ